MNDELLYKISNALFDFSGLQILESQFTSVKLFLEKKAAEKGLSPEDFCECICENVGLQTDLINFITVNETYFFREEKQFDFLKNEVFPKFLGKKVNIWSAACSTGEEPLSLLALSILSNLNATVFATDIDKIVLQKFKAGRYTSNSFRPDGQKYHHLLENFFTKSKDGLFYDFDLDFVNKVKSAQYNLTSGTFPFADFSEKMDIIFVRNVFIYFDVETRKKVLKFLSSQLKEDGIMFFSISEVASIDESVIPPDLEKVNSKDVYYFRHKKQNIGTLLEKMTSSHGILSTKMREKMQNQNKSESSTVKSAKEYLQKIRANSSSNSSSPVPISANLPSSSVSLEQISINKMSKVPQMPQLSVEQIYKNVCNLINIRDFENAKKQVQMIKSDKKTYQYYMLAYIAYHSDEKSEAEKFFSAAEMMNKDFWPAFFYHGLVLKDIGKPEKAAFCFKKCRELMEKTSYNPEYNFLLDSFSPSYIYSLCQKLQEN